MSKKLLSVILAIITMASLCIVNASAANDASASTGVLHEGDKVIFTASLTYGDDLHCVAAINGYVDYDAEVLSVANARMVESPGFGSVTANTNTAGKVIFNAADGVFGKDFSKGNGLVKITFDVKKDATDATIKFATEELFDVTLDATSLQAAEGVAKKDITEGVTASVEVQCVKADDTDTNSDKPVDTNSDKPVDTNSDKPVDTNSDKPVDTNKAPVTGDVATVAMMLVFAAAVAVLVSKKRA